MTDDECSGRDATAVAVAVSSSADFSGTSEPASSTTTTRPVKATTAAAAKDEKDDAAVPHLSALYDIANSSEQGHQSDDVEDSSSARDVIEKPTASAVAASQPLADSSRHEPSKRGKVPANPYKRKRNSSSPNDSGRISKNNDPHNLIERFVIPQKEMFTTALHEIKSGYKRSCWLWFVLPTAPYVVNGIERGSQMNRHYALRTDEQARAYLRVSGDKSVDGVDLRSNYIDMMCAVANQLGNGRNMYQLFGSMDAPKALSSIQLFRRISLSMGDREICDLCCDVLDLVDDKRLA